MYVFDPDDRDWRSRWRSIDAFVRDWLEPTYVRHAAAGGIIEIEERIGVRLPPSFREWCYFMWATEQLERTFGFRDDFVVERLKDHDAVSLLAQGEGDFYWAVETKSLEQDDPPVVAYYLDHDLPIECFAENGPWAPTVSSFAFDYLMVYLRNRGGGFSTRLSSPAFSREALIADLGDPKRFGHLEIFSREGLFAYITCYADNWHFKNIGVVYRDRFNLGAHYPSIQRLEANAHIFR